MKKCLFLCLFLFCSSLAFCQIVFEKAYYINNQGEKTEGFIKNVDWKNNPSHFEFKASLNDDSETLGLDQAREFGFGQSLRYQRAKVLIDKTVFSVQEESSTKEPVLVEETLFLNILIEGQASLGLYVNGNLRKYFYSHDNGDFEQLIYKKYKNEKGAIATNNKFREQIWLNLRCEALEMDEVDVLSYTHRQLIHVFEKYNECQQVAYTKYTNIQKRELIHLSLRPRFTFNSLINVVQPSFSTSNEFDPTVSIGLGIEFEYILPFNNNKWSLVVEPTFRNYNQSITFETSQVSGGSVSGRLAYTSIELPFALRHYFFINPESKIFVNGGPVFDFGLNSYLQYLRPDGSEYNYNDLIGNVNLAIGSGYKYKDRYSLELRYFTSRILLGKVVSYESKYHAFSVIFGYTLF
ncbi:hypothetical protein GCM10007049_13160 [Echinicola pacifica]|uniref:Outer membrane protein beta-barrel domain-containing protein n=1 Tax=Echinicola pacifica TaxID=346377 RepID=A0A918PSW5_9BACT|nr:porin family protein [Echinicola pacifica]GGZ21772.1 hypothetical protein GCM10007049_13160 [Echinicola pacifica]